MTGRPQGRAGIREPICPAPLESSEHGEAGCVLACDPCRWLRNAGQTPAFARRQPGLGGAPGPGGRWGDLGAGLAQVASSVSRTVVLAGSGVFSSRLAGSINTTQLSAFSILPGCLAAPRFLVYLFFLVIN